MATLACYAARVRLLMGAARRHGPGVSRLCVILIHSWIRSYPDLEAFKFQDSEYSNRCFRRDRRAEA